MQRPLIGIAAAAGVLLAGGGVFALVHEIGTPDPVPVAETPSHIATLKMSLPWGVEAKVLVDGVVVSIVRDGHTLPMMPGKHHVRVLTTTGTCDDVMTFEPGKTITAECHPRQRKMDPTPPQRVNLDKIVSWSFKDSKLHDVLMTAAATCGVNLVVPGDLDAKITTNLVNVPCDQALEVLLESHGLWYAYRADANLLRIAPRKQIETELDERRSDEPRAKLPPGNKIDIDLKGAPLRDALRLIAGSGAGNMNIVVPEPIDGQVTIRLKGVPWERAFEAVLESHSLWYRYREEGNLIRVAPRKELDAEAAERR